jgi:serine O-acetyltransferase
MGTTVDEIVDGIYESYQKIGGINHIDGTNLPSVESIVRIIVDLESIVFPGFKSEGTLDGTNIRRALAENVNRVVRDLSREIYKSFCFRLRREHPNREHFCEEDEDIQRAQKHAEDLTLAFLGELPRLREMIKLDVEAAYNGDPAAQSQEEVILAYPGVEAIMVHRLAHELWQRDIPLIPRMMSEHIHGKTGIDIHPAANIGEYFFIDHATGVVIGETTTIGRHVKIYQGVTIGALSVEKSYANVKRHPTIEDDVTIYAGATILGGDTVIGRGAIIGGNVWITSSVPAGSKIYNRPVDYIRK